MSPTLPLKGYVAELEASTSFCESISDTSRGFGIMTGTPDSFRKKRWRWRCELAMPLLPLFDWTHCRIARKYLLADYITLLVLDGHGHNLPLTIKELKNESIHIRIAGADAPEVNLLQKQSLAWLTNRILGQTVYRIVVNVVTKRRFMLPAEPPASFFDLDIFRSYLLSLSPPIIGSQLSDLELLLEGDFDECVTRFAGEGGGGVLYVIEAQD
ncbi:hypothetical protein EV360DRAFT_85145 [Lentinula raphanica]|nr:hypothetical protein EV360DRAFT_85145 [Lentinula raphanica]